MTDAVDRFSGIGRKADLAAPGDDELWCEALGIGSTEFLNVIVGLNKASGMEVPEADYRRRNLGKGAR